MHITQGGVCRHSGWFYTFSDSQKTTNTGKKAAGVWQPVNDSRNWPACKINLYKESKHQDDCASSFTGYSSHCQTRTEACGNGY